MKKIRQLGQNQFLQIPICRSIFFFTFFFNKGGCVKWYQEAGSRGFYTLSREKSQRALRYIHCQPSLDRLDDAHNLDAQYVSVTTVRTRTTTPDRRSGGERTGDKRGTGDQATTNQNITTHLHTRNHWEQQGHHQKGEIMSKPHCTHKKE